MKPSMLRSGMFLDAARDLGLPILQLERLARTASHRYKTYSIAKRRGGSRVIHQPSAELKELQRWIVRRLEGLLQVHENATAYRRGRGILNNAESHVNAKALMKLDFIDFFHCITDIDISSALAGVRGISAHDISFVASTVLFKDKARGIRCLTIGAPSSPLFSNAACYSLDLALERICIEVGATYTRYADDITVSADDQSKIGLVRPRIMATIANCTQPNVRVNAHKTVLVTRRHRMTVTGLVLGNDGRVRVSRQQLRRLDSGLDRFKRGIELSPDMSPQKLQGWLSYAASISSDFLDRMVAKHGIETLKRLRLESGDDGNATGSPSAE